MRGLALALLLTLASVALPQDYRPVGQIESIEYQNQVRSADGRTVEGTEFFHLEYKVSIKTVQTAEVKEDAGGPLRCVQECQGKVHKKHDECTPGSCDVPCTKNHQRQIRGEYKPNTANMRAARADSGRLARAAGAGLGPDHWSSATSGALRQIKEQAEELHGVRMGHSDKACGILHGWHQLRKNEVFVKGEFRKVGYYMSRGKKTPIDRPAGTHEKMVAETWIPQADPSRISEGWNCRCFIPDQPKTPVTAVRDGFPTKVTGPTRTPTYSGLGWRKPDGTVVIPDPSQVTVKCTGDGIDNVTLVVENKTTEDLICTTDAGTICDPKDPNVQIMCLLAALDFVIKAGSTTEISLTDDGRGAAQFSVRAACMEMQKMPPKGVPLEMKPNKDDAMAALANKASRSLAVGPWDQARLWIYTDKATLAEINERMSPGVTAGQYVDALYDVERVGGVNMADPKFRRCFELSLLPMQGASADAAAWFVSRLAEFDPAAVAQKMQTDGPAGVARLASGDRAVLQQLGRMLGAAAGAKGEAVRTAALKLMLSVPEAVRADVGRYGATQYLTDSLVSKSAAEVEAAIDVALAYKVTDTGATLAFLSEQGATDAIKTKAKEALKALPPGS